MKKSVFFLAVLCLFVFIPKPYIEAKAADSVNAYVTISDEKGLLALSHEAVKVTDSDADGVLTINDALFCAHETYYEGGAATGYSSEPGEYGLSLKKLWGIKQGYSFGYYVNHASAMSLTDEIQEGTVIAAFVYTDLIAWSDTYCYFDTDTFDVQTGKEFTMTLLSAGFDANWNPVVLPVEGARILVNGNETNYITGADGSVTMKSDEAGKTIISAASSTQTLVPPVAVVTVEAYDAIPETGDIDDENLPNHRAISFEKIDELIDRILSTQTLTDESLAAGAGATSEWYVLGLSQRGDKQDFSSYQQSLLNVISNSEGLGAVTKQKYALVLAAVGADQARINELAGDTIGTQGIMSWVFGLHLLNNGYCDEDITAQNVIEQLKLLQLEDGGWALSGTNGDVDVTAMVLQALAPYYNEVREPAEQAVEFLSKQRLPEGDYKGFGTRNAESGAQVIIALTALGIDLCEDERFAENGITLIDGLLRYRLADGSFCHSQGGDYNYSATVQAFLALHAVERCKKGLGSIYLLHHAEEQGFVGNQIGKNEAAELFSSSEATALTPAESAVYTGDSEKHMGYKIWFTLGIVAAAILISLIMFLKGKRNKKNYFVIALVTVLLIPVILFTDIKTPDEYYCADNLVAESIGTVQISIRCDTVVGKSEADYIPTNGCILDYTELPFAEGDSVLNVLTTAARKYKLSVERSGINESMAYISSINYLCEYDFGELSGWTFSVNGENSSVGCGEYIVEEGDTILWQYTCDLGNDLTGEERKDEEV